MMSTIISAIISGVVALVVCVINSNANHRKTIAEIEKMNDLQQYRIGELEKKVDKHNNLMERTFRLEEKMKTANHRIDDLEAAAKK